MTKRSTKQVQRAKKRAVKDLPLKAARADKTRGGQSYLNPKSFQIISAGSDKS